MKTFIFDYDDTLAPNQHFYSHAQLDFVRWVMENVGHRGPDAHYILNLQVRLDHEAAKRDGFGIEQFPTSFVDTYRQICEDLGKTPSVHELSYAYAIGERAFDEELYRDHGLFPGVPESLDFLVGRGDELILMTKGDPRAQWPKIEATGVSRWFGDAICVVPRKDISVFEEIVGDRERSRVWKVGNSVPSDITPALQIGLGAVYVPCETWALERDHEGVPRDHPRFNEIPDFKSFIDAYPGFK